MVAAYRRKKALIRGPFTQGFHKQFVEEDLLGVDVMPFAANIAASNLSLQAPRFLTNRIQIAIWDSTDLRPGRTIPSASHISAVLGGQSSLDSFDETGAARKGSRRLTDDDPGEIALRNYDIVLMNPPFTRQERIPAQYKEVLADRFKTFGSAVQGQMGYHNYFVLLADKFLVREGRMGLVLPATVLRVLSSREIREHLVSNYEIEYIITVWQRSAFSESAAFREILLVAKKNPQEREQCIVAVLHRLPESGTEAIEFAERLSDAHRHPPVDPWTMETWSSTPSRRMELQQIETICLDSSRSNTGGCVIFGQTHSRRLEARLPQLRPLRIELAAEWLEVWKRNLGRCQFTFLSS